MTLDECHAAGMTTRQAMAATGRTRSAVVAWAWRQGKTWAPASVDYSQKINYLQAVDIYHSRGTATAAALAEQYGITLCSVYDIWSGRSWSCVTGAGEPA